MKAMDAPHNHTSSYSNIFGGNIAEMHVYVCMFVCLFACAQTHIQRHLLLASSANVNRELPFLRFFFLSFVDWFVVCRLVCMYSFVCAIYHPIIYSHIWYTSMLLWQTQDHTYYGDTWASNGWKLEMRYFLFEIAYRREHWHVLLASFRGL